MMKKPVTFLTVLMVVFCIFFGVLSCNGQEQSKLEIPPDFTTYTDENDLFTISYPSEWETALSIMGIAEDTAKAIITSIDSDIPIELSLIRMNSPSESVPVVI